MRYQTIDEISMSVADLKTAVVPFRKLGLRVDEIKQGGVSTAVVFLGAGAAQVRLTMRSPLKELEALGPGVMKALREQLFQMSLVSATLRVDNLNRAIEELAQRGWDVNSKRLSAAMKGPNFQFLGADDESGVPLYLAAVANSAIRHLGNNVRHDFPIRRLDHLAFIATNLDAQTRFWVEVLGMPLFGEVVTPIMIIRQFKIGDAIIELVAPASSDSPIHQRKPGLISMVSLEVADLNAAVAQARAAGFTVPDPAKGALPGTLTATIPAAEMSGLALQLLMYV